MLNDVAVIGMNLRCAGSSNPSEFWSNLIEGVEASSEFQDSELIASGIDQKTFLHPDYVKKGFILNDIDLFDAEFFNITPSEAKIMDPQHRLFLESVWTALEDAAYDPKTYDEPIGLFAGSFLSTYLLKSFNSGAVKDLGNIITRHSNDKDYLTTRVSYKLNLKGPSIAVQTSCSTSLVAVHLACQSLLNGESQLAVAGGVNITVPERAGYMFTEGGLYSPDGTCRAFDKDASGTVFGNGLGVVVLKRLEDALNDNDNIRAVIKSSSINNDGADKVGFTAPSLSGQAAVIIEAMELADVKPNSISYVETHGTGTPLGDPIELAALTQAFHSFPSDQAECLIGSLKPNIGHLGTASGIAGLIKTVLALENEIIPRNINFKSANPKIDFESSPFRVVTDNTAWPRSSKVRRAGVSSFGMGGTNAHVILEEAPFKHKEPEPEVWTVVPLSAKTASALEQKIIDLAQYTELNSDLRAIDIAYTNQVGRNSFDFRYTVTCSGRHNLNESLKRESSNRISSFVKPLTSKRPLVWMFPGQSSQYPKMTEQLYKEQPVFREYMDQCAELLRLNFDLDLYSIIYSDDSIKKSRIYDTRYAQPAIFSVQYALSHLFLHWGVSPDAYIGHSIGEYTAACLSGVFSLEDTLSIIVERGRLMQNTQKGKMISVALSEEYIKSFYEFKNASIAAVNGPNLCVLSGSAETIEEIEAVLSKRNIMFATLKTSHAFHSEMMDPILKEFEKSIESRKINVPHMPYISNVSGTWITSAEVTDPTYWSAHIREAVRFSSGIETIARDYGSAVFLEIGPGDTLVRLSSLHEERFSNFRALSTLPRSFDGSKKEPEVVQEALGALWISGQNVDWEHLNDHCKRSRLNLPTYPFERKSYWLAPTQDTTTDSTPQTTQNAEIDSWFYFPTWKKTIPPLRNESKAKRRWLIFDDETLFGKRLKSFLENRGDTVVFVSSKSPSHTEKKLEAIRSNIQEDYQKLFIKLAEQDVWPTHIIFMWNFGPAIEEQNSHAYGESATERFLRLVHLSQALDSISIQNPIKLIYVSNKSYKVFGTDTVEPCEAVSLGLLKTIPQELPFVTCKSIDIGNADLREIYDFELIVGELLSEDNEEIVAYRDNDRWVQDFEPVKLISQNNLGNYNLVKYGVYLVTGGLGGLGLSFATWLAEKVSARLILISRSSFPERHLWDKLLRKNGKADPLNQKILRILRIEELGAKVLICKADVANEEQMEEVVRIANTKFGAINGCIHSAGVPTSGLLKTKTRSDVVKVFAPKVQGTVVLEKVLKNEPMSFLIICSSLSSIRGGLGQADYCAANAFLDAFAQSRFRKNNFPVISINWGSWSEVGMSINALSSAVNVGENSQINPFDEQLIRSQQMNPISPSDGVEALERILQLWPAPQVIVSPKNLLKAIEAAKKFTINKYLEANKLRDTATVSERPELHNEYVAPVNWIEEKLLEIWQQVLGLSSIGTHDNFFELGGHSLLSIQVINRIREEFDVNIDLNEFFESPRIFELALPVSVKRIEMHGKLVDLEQMLAEAEQR